MSEFNEERARELKRMMNDPSTDAQTQIDCADEILDMVDQEHSAELARNALFDLLEGLKEDLASAKCPEDKRRIEQQIEQIELARLACIQRVTDDGDE